MFNKKKIMCACCAFCMAAQAQNASVSGRVQSSETKEPLQSVNIVIPNLELGSTTDINGQFTINDIPLDNIELEISILGYRDTTIFIQIDNRLVNLGNIFLDPEALHFEEINVEVHSELDPTSSLSNVSISGKKMQENMKGSIAQNFSLVRVSRSSYIHSSDSSSSISRTATWSERDLCMGPYSQPPTRRV